MDKRHLPEKAPKIINRIRSVRGGKMSDSDFGKRMTGEGEYAESIHQLFESSCKRYQMNEERLHLPTTLFTRHPAQLEIF